MRNWTQTVVLVTGGSHGIGRATALLLAERGATVFICGRSKQALDETARLAEELAGELVAIVADVTEEAQVKALLEAVASLRGRLDVLINNAGMLGPRTPIEEVSLNDWQQTLDVNLSGTFLVSRESIGLLRRSEQGLVINLSSSVGRQGRASWGAYSVAKHGVEGLTAVLAEELQGDGICVVSVNPGGTATRMRAEAYPDEDPKTLPSPEAIGQTLVRLADELTLEQSGSRFDSRTLLR
ncbi:MAG: SDR family oxidoreductase [Bradymonadaceae bacterium]|nr:SDR family oxidoreductase [Lujinxingiaceae bacterium]